MPWAPADASRFTKKAKSSSAKRQWSAVADAMLAKGMSEARAIRAGNAVVKRRRKKSK